MLFPRAAVSRTMAAVPLALPLLLLVLAAAVTGCGATTVAYNDRAVVGQRRIILSGSIHYPRSTPQVIDEMDTDRLAPALSFWLLYWFYDDNVCLDLI